MFLDDNCFWCNHPLKVADRIWTEANSYYSIPICANYCDPKTCKEEDCEQNCGEVALSTEENINKVLREVAQRKVEYQKLVEDGAKILNNKSN